MVSPPAPCMATPRYPSRRWSATKVSLGKRAMVPWGKAMISSTWMRWQGVPASSYSKPSGRTPAGQAASTRARPGLASGNSAAKATSAPRAVATWRTSERKKASPTTPAVPSATVRSRSPGPGARRGAEEVARLLAMGPERRRARGPRFYGAAGPSRQGRSAGPGPEDDDRDAPRGARGVVAVGPVAGHGLVPEPRALLLRRLAGVHRPAIAPDLDIGVRVRAEVVVPGGVLLVSALGGDDDGVRPALDVEQRRRPARARTSPDVVEQQDREDPGQDPPADAPVCRLVDAAMEVHDAPENG